MSITVTQLLVALGQDPTKPITSDNAYGVGHLLHTTRIFTCAGTPDADGNMTDKHVIGTITAVPDKDANGNPVNCIPTERADEATWELDPAQVNIDPHNPVCQICGQPPVL